MSDAAEAPKPNPLSVTHAYAIEMPKASPNAPVRRMELLLLQSEGFVVVMTTQWPGEAEPVSTRFSLSRVGLEMLTGLLSNAHRIRDFPVKEADDGDAKPA